MSEEVTTTQTGSDVESQAGDAVETQAGEQSQAEEVTEETTETKVETGEESSDKPLMASEDDSEEADGAEDADPQEYGEFELPEGMELDAAALEKATPVFQELGLKQEQAQKLVSLYAEMRSNIETEAAQNLNTQRQQWREEFKKDPESPKILADAKKALKAFGDDEMISLMNDSWMGDYPGLIRFLGRVGKAAGDDSFVEGRPANSGPKRAEDVLFGDMFK